MYLLSVLKFKKRDFVFLFIIFLLYFFFYSLLSYKIFSTGFYPDKLIVYAEKAKLAVDGFPPRLENAGFVYPLLPIILNAIFKYPFIVQGLVAAFVSAFLLLYSAKFSRNLFSFVLFISLHLGFIYLSLLEFDILIFFLGLVVVTYLLVKYFETNFSFYLFSGGFICGFLFFINFSSLLISLYYALLIFLEIKGNFRRKLSLVMVYLLPIFFFFLSYSYLNYLFKGDFFYYLGAISLKNYSSLNLKHFFVLCLSSLPYFWGFIYVKRWKLAYIFPLLLLFFFYLFPFPDTSYVMNFSYCVLFWFFFLFFSNYMEKRKIILFLSFISIMASPLLIFKYGNFWEKNFFNFLFNNQYVRNLKEAKRVASFINSTNNKLFLMDDKSFYKTVFFVKNIKKLILPYMYIYKPFLINPHGNVDFVIVKVGDFRDDFYNMYPEVINYELNNCTFYASLGKVFIFKCK